MIKKNSIIVICFLFCSCVSPKFIKYDISLFEVSRPAETKKRYGEQKIFKVSSEDEKFTQAFEDEMIGIFWELSATSIAFVLTNKTEHTIKIIWDEGAFQDEAGMSHRIVHGEIRNIDKTRSIPPSVIVRKGKINTIIYPADYIIDFQSELKPILPYRISSEFVDRKYGRLVESEELFFDSVNSKVGKTLQVLLPLEIEGNKNDYIFIFKINSFEDLSEKRISNTQ